MGAQKQKGGITMKCKILMKGVLTGMCVLAMTGCGAGGGSKNSSEPLAADSSTDNAVKDGDRDNAGNQPDGKKDNKPNNAADNTEGNNLFDTASLNGRVVRFSDSGCTISPTISSDDGKLASGAAPGYEKEEDNVNVSYKEDCTFQTAAVNVETGNAELDEASVSVVKKQSSILVYGDFQDEHNLTADRVVIVYFE